MIRCARRRFSAIVCSSVAASRLSLRQMSEIPGPLLRDDEIVAPRFEHHQRVADAPNGLQKIGDHDTHQQYGGDGDGRASHTEADDQFQRREQHQAER